MRRKLQGLLIIGLLTTAASAFAQEDPPPPPPPPPLEESSGSSESSAESPASGSWSIKGQNGLLDKGSGHKRKPMLSFFLGLPFGGYGGYGAYYGVFNLGLGARFYIPIVSEGFIPPLNDSFGIEFGADTIVIFGGYGYGTAVALEIPAEARWNFHLFPKLEVYAKLGLGLGMFFLSRVYIYPVFVGNVGALLKLSDVISLRVEVGYPAVKVGIGIAF